MARVSRQLVFTFPVPFEFPAHWRAAQRQLNLRRSGFFQNERRAVPALHEISRQMAFRGQMRFEFGLADAFVPESTFDGELQLGTPYMEVCQRRALHSEAGNDNRSDPIFAAFVRQIENELQLFSRN